MKFRKSRIVLLAGFLVLVSSVGYWFMYMSSRPRTHLSRFSGYTGHSSDVTVHRSVSGYRKVSADEDGDYGGLFRDRGRNRVKPLARIGLVGQQGSDSDSFRQEKAAVVPVGSKQEIAGKQSAAELKVDDDDNNDSDDTEIDIAKNADEPPAAAARVEQRHKDDRHSNRLPVAAADDDDDDYDDYGDKRNIKIDNIKNTKQQSNVRQDQEIEIDSMKNSRQEFNDRHDRETLNRPSFEGKRTSDDAADGNVKFDTSRQHLPREIDLAENRHAPVLESQIKQSHSHSNAADEVLKWREETQVISSSFIRPLRLMHCTH